MKQFLGDLAYCFKICLYVFAITFLLGCLIGLFTNFGNLKEILMWGCRIVQITSAFGMAIAGISFVKMDLMRPLNYQKQWEMYFSKLNLSHAIFFICLFDACISFLLEMAVGFIR